VDIYESWQQGRISQIDDMSSRRQRDIARADGLNAIPHDYDNRMVQKTTRFGIKQFSGVNYCDTCRLHLRRSKRDTGNQDQSSDARPSLHD
jgi:hypothetical protein